MTTAALSAFVAQLSAEWRDHDLLLEIANHRIAALAGHLRGLLSREGYAPEDIEELKEIITRLFGEHLLSLHATSIQSHQVHLRSYRSYWTNDALGRFFLQKNIEFLQRGGQIKRLFLCDSLRDAVNENWFVTAVALAAFPGMEIKIMPLTVGESIPDLGIYRHHRSPERESLYALLAPEQSNQDGILHVSVVANREELHALSDRFDHLWRQAGDLLRVLPPVPADTAAPHGHGRVNDLFQGRVVLRKMTCLDNLHSLIGKNNCFMRKFDPRYAQCLVGFLSAEYPGVETILYVGDTYENDGSVIRNLQGMGKKVLGFICEPDLPFFTELSDQQIGSVQLNDVLYAARWSELVRFAEMVAPAALEHTVAIIDIDKTMWAPKGTNDQSLHECRVNAIARLLERYLLQPLTTQQDEFLVYAREVARTVYRFIGQIKFHPLTRDNEDFKAVISLLAAFNLLKGSIPGDNAELGIDLHFTPREELEQFLEQTILSRYTTDGGGILSLLSESRHQTYMHESENCSDLYGINFDLLRTDLDLMVKAIYSSTPAPFQEFRLIEYEETLKFARNRPEDGDYSHCLTLNKAVWDFVAVLKEKNASLLALSDRPDEATCPEHSISLLDQKMAIHGVAIRDELLAVLG